MRLNIDLIIINDFDKYDFNTKNNFEINLKIFKIQLK